VALRRWSPSPWALRRWYGVPIFLWAFYEYVFGGSSTSCGRSSPLQMLGVGFLSMRLALMSIYLKRMEFRIVERIDRALRQRQGGP